MNTFLLILLLCWLGAGCASTPVDINARPRLMHETVVVHGDIPTTEYH